MFIKNFLFERTFTVRVGSARSNSQYQEEGVPQGSILSITLFSIKINIVKCLTPSIDCALYVNDFVICYRATHMNIVEQQLELNLNKVNKWARENGLEFSKSKTKCVHFCSLRKVHNDPLLKIDDSKIPVVASSWKKIKYPNLRSAMKPVLHSDDLPVPTPPVNKDLLSSSDEEMPSREDSAESISLEDIDSTYSGTSGNEPHWITQGDLNDVACDLYLSKQQSELLVSRLKQWNLVQEDVRITSFRNRNK